MTDSDRYAWIHAVGSGGTVFRSSDAGQTWALEENVGTTENLMDVSFVDARVGVVVGENSAIFHTTNGGLIWEQYTPLEEDFLVTLFGVYINGAPGPIHIVGEKGLFLKTEDGEDWVVAGVSCGETETESSCTVNSELTKADWDSSTADNLYSIRFKDSINGLAIGGAGKVLVTSDGGESFMVLKPVDANAGPTLYGLAMDDLGNLAVGGGGGVVFHVTPETTDESDAVTFRWHGCAAQGGCSLAVPSTLSDVSRTDSDLFACSLVEGHIFVGGQGGYVAKHVDGQWTTQSLGEESEDVTGIYFSTTRTAVLVTRGGTIYRTSDGGSTWAAVGEDVLAGANFSLNSVSGRNAGDIAGAPRALASATLLLLSCALALTWPANWWRFA